MGNIRGKFTDQDSYIASQQGLLTVNNTAEFNVTINDNDYQRATSAVFAQQSLTRNFANSVPDATVAGNQTIGAALAGIDQPPDASVPSRVNPCFIATTTVRLGNNEKKFICDVKLKDKVVAFDPLTGALGEGLVTDTFTHLRDRYLLIEFEDGHTTGVDVEGLHRYWTGSDFKPIRDLQSVLRLKLDGWFPCNIIGSRIIEEEVVLYNFTVKGFHNYVANGDAVSNLKPLEGNEF